MLSRKPAEPCPAISAGRARQRDDHSGSPRTMPDEKTKQERAKELVDSVLANTHESLKWSWQVVMGFALYTAVQETYHAMTSRPPMSTPELTLCSVIASFVFLPTFIRFFYGDNRYLDLHYSELRQWNSLEGYERDLETSLSKSRRLVDVLLLLSHGIVFAFLALAIPKPEMFFCFYGVLLLINCFWLYIVVRMNERIVIEPNGSGVKDLLRGLALHEMEQRTTSFPKRDAAARYWIKNNLWHLVIFVLLYLARTSPLEWNLVATWHRQAFLYLYVAACVSNSAFDLYYQWDFYLPKLDEVYREARKEAATVAQVLPRSPSSAA
jgi:hypothetical protein